MEQRNETKLQAKDRKKFALSGKHFRFLFLFWNGGADECGPRVSFLRVRESCLNTSGRTPWMGDRSVGGPLHCFL